ncbi:hypothetical protein [Desulfosarcina ovata]|uniref:DUF465 domain-containing protein n=2 Tax=Desulfosarcina ovata TaxID=83564 RepID=A0A5K8A4B6_9BACT|nr:hypothetical protein [Desulfosarcina ovata]BBO80044.1 hypothetical protein DSCO28_06100 [Desulfosarcina ovata subsp. sediminis]BBO87359.1 hypothetical protein DSCOOX_05390 [Desulfosarcina ovata subsp. ovata]
MSLRMIAKDLYRLQQVVDRLDKALSDCPPNRSDALKLKLAQAKNERDQVKRILDGQLDR